ncbi:MAG TPA: methionine--tRNA ligase [Candidatus Xenobia bacterium]|nr:methionine--tRNA ligase [Candidatus Xenobia bacterium]
MPKFYLTTPLYYVNARPHIGHTYTTVVADTIARYKRMRGYDVVFLSGTDEHGETVARSARKAGKEPQAFADEVAAHYQRVWKALGLEYDRFIRTTEPRHDAGVKKLFAAVKKAGFIYQGEYEGLYCVSCELYVTDPTPEGNCPTCGRKPEPITEKNLFFKLSAFQDKLLAHYQKHPEFIQPESRRNEVISFVESGLRDLSVTRTRFRWGIPVPGMEEHVFYVWFDALTGYLSGIGYGGSGAEANEFDRLWPADLQLVGKEIVRFHAVYWPAFLLAAKLPLPKTIYAHGWWLFESEKMSKSRGNIIRPEPIHRVIGADGLRYYFLREMVFGQDSSFTYDALLTRYNSDLANDYGNLASRVLNMIERYFSGQIPYPSPGADRTDEDAALAAVAEQSITQFQQCFDRYEFSRGLEAVWSLVSAANKYIVETEPWVLAEDPAKRARLATVLWTAAEALRISTILLYPVIPTAAERVRQQLGLEGELATTNLDDLSWGQLATGLTIGRVEAVFPRLEKDEAIEQLWALEKEMTAALASPAKAEKPVEKTWITIDEFAKVEMRVAEVRTAERVKGANKLLKLTVDVGDEVRQVIAGIAEAYTPEEVIGKKVVIVTNLQPRKIRGLESNGMIVAASVGEKGRPVLVTFAEDVPVGARLK